MSDVYLVNHFDIIYNKRKLNLFSECVGHTTYKNIVKEMMRVKTTKKTYSFFSGCGEY